MNLSQIFDYKKLNLSQTINLLIEWGSEGGLEGDGFDVTEIEKYKFVITKKVNKHG